ncbi:MULTISPECIES: cation transporter [unclassified Enterococcus]|uniref:cation transporter n=1 Tax=unclassified Enterococcus TaxID=2608891 RepID=UPI0015577958|nr:MULTISPECIES: cation transporter [unclassified Enterococcus]MBS7578343.1 cation transporter [Enterococcus sp. MMGLQ5-2]MBS7585580.1 cation transporter [Enterococcus sp. MMGLQ5-1]NPD13439.1 cation transporter [Enterococcus sp. MMGLQ5-1]NPD38174.1 cation transporter [Enterococcus sp. MMGLQ5-2]
MKNDSQLNPKKVEQNALLMGTILYSVMCIASFSVYFISKIQAMFLDASFILITVCSTIIASIISRHSERRSTRFPAGLFFLEPLYAIFRSVLIIVLTILSCTKVSFSAWQYFVYGKGEVINVLPIIPYEILAVILCAFLYLYYMRQNKKINNMSTLINAEAKTTLLDGLMCAGIGIVALLVAFIPENTPLDFIRYTGDFFITVTLSLMVIKAPFKILKNSFIEVVHGTMLDDSQKREIETVIYNTLPFQLKEYLSCQIYKVGVSLQISILVAHDCHQVVDYQALLRYRQQLKDILVQKFNYIEIQIILS